jgi:hypothetical protein
MKTFKDFSFEEIKDIYGDLIFKYGEDMGYIENVIKEKDGSIYFDVIFNGKNLTENRVIAEMFVRGIEPISIEDIETEKYLEFISKLENIVVTKEFCVYSN